MGLPVCFTAVDIMISKKGCDVWAIAQLCSVVSRYDLLVQGLVFAECGPKIIRFVHETLLSNFASVKAHITSRTDPQVS